jgi:hypothetical protein
MNTENAREYGKSRIKRDCPESNSEQPLFTVSIRKLSYNHLQYKGGDYPDIYLNLWGSYSSFQFPNA